MEKAPYLACYFPQWLIYRLSYLKRDPTFEGISTSCMGNNTCSDCQCYHPGRHITIPGRKPHPARIGEHTFSSRFRRRDANPGIHLACRTNGHSRTGKRGDRHINSYIDTVAWLFNSSWMDNYYPAERGIESGDCIAIWDLNG